MISCQIALYCNVDLLIWYFLIAFYSLTNKNQACDNQVKSCSNLNHFPVWSHWDQKCIWFALRNKVNLNTNVETCLSLKLKRNQSKSQVNSIREESWRIVIISGTVHWFWLKTSFHPLLWTSSGLTGSWKLSAYIRFGSLRSVKSVKARGNWKPKKCWKC